VLVRPDQEREDPPVVDDALALTLLHPQRAKGIGGHFHKPQGCPLELGAV